MSAPHYPLLGLACSPRLDEDRARRMRESARRHCCWPLLPRMAASQRIGPLLYWHLKEYGIDYPRQTRRALAGMYARQKAVAAAQADTLAEIVGTFERAGIDSVVIKGGALAHVIYPEPGLRPMEDLDILVRPERAEAARKLLADIGFHAPPAQNRYETLQHHLPMAQRTRDGITVGVEVHTRAFNLLMRDTLSLDSMLRPALTYRVAGQAMQTLHPTQMLWMQYLGLRKLAEPMRFIQLADLAGMAEVLLEHIDWPRLLRDYPDLWNAYEAIHAFTPLNAAVCAKLGLDPERPAAMAMIGQDYGGWPLRRFGDAANRADTGRILAQTLFPPEWWARLVYGVRLPRGMARILWLRHPATFLHQGLRRLYLGPVNEAGFFKAPA